MQASQSAGYCEEEPFEVARSTSDEDLGATNEAGLLRTWVPRSVVWSYALAAAATAALSVAAFVGSGFWQSRAVVKQSESSDYLPPLVGLSEEAAPSCTKSGVDPWVTGKQIKCCVGLAECLKQWTSPTDDRWSWRCYSSTSNEAKSAKECKSGERDGKYYPHFDTSPDYLKIADRVRGVTDGQAGSLSDNYYLVLGDQGGCDGGCDGCCERQKEVAGLMQAFVKEKKQRNPNTELLFVLVVGDNFYWTGASEGRFHGTWLDIYGPELTSVPWFAVMGNHDYGNSDPTSGCPNVSPRFECTENNAHDLACGGPKPYSTKYQGYNSNALNVNKGGVDGEARRNWHAPDYTFYYSLPALDFEIIAMDWNYMDLYGLGGDGPYKSASKVLAHCGSLDALKTSMAAIMEASTDILINRSVTAAYSNVAILGHYPSWAQDNKDFRQMFLDKMPSDSKGYKVYNFFGHAHTQVCFDKEDGECVNFQTGGGGGCCGDGDVPAGFVSISWNSDKKQVVDCFTPDSRCTVASYTREIGGAPELGGDVCNNTIDEPSCPGYTGPPPDMAGEKMATWTTSARPAKLVKA